MLIKWRHNVISVEMEDVLEKIDYDSAKEILNVFFHRFIQQKVSNVEIAILITKKSFWSYEVLCTEFNNKSEGKIEWLSDRYFQKILDFNRYDGKTIVIVDDTMNTGIAIREFYRLMREQCKSSKIVPIVCLLNEKYNVEEHIIDQTDIDFHKSLQVMRRATPAAIGEMCVFETAMFHDDLVSYIVDLPILEQKQENQNWNRKIKMSMKTFYHICEGNSLWTYYKCNYNLFPNKEVKTGFFNLHSSFLQARLDGFLMNLVVKVQYKEIIEDEDENIEVVFTPFAILNSVNTTDLEKCFLSLFNECSYKSQLRKPTDDDLLLNYYTAMYRAVVYCISMYIGVKFIEFIDLEQELRLNNKKQFTQKFYESIEKIFPSNDNYKKFDELKFFSKFLSLKAFTKINNVTYNSFDNGEMKFINYSKEDWFAFLYEKIISNKRCLIGKKCFSSEEFEDAIEEKLDFDDTEQKISLLTQVLLEALNKSILSNYLQYDDRTKTIIRGYRYGENSELLLPYDARIFYKGIQEYYKKVNKSFFFDYFDMFCINFRNFLDKIGIFNYLITERQFNFFVRYFSDIPRNEIETQIENKKYLLTEDYCKQDRYIKQVLNKIENFVSNMNIGKEE